MNSEFTQQNDGTTYVPFSDGIIFQTQGYEVINQNKFKEEDTYTDYYDSFFRGDTQKNHKCQYCGKPDYHANCRGHERWCPIYCGDDVPGLPLGNDFFILGTILLIYTLVKKFKK